MKGNDVLTTTTDQETPLKGSAEQSKSPMKWQRIGKYTIRCAPWQISKSMVDGSTLYMVWKDGTPEPLGYFESAADAKAWICSQTSLDAPATPGGSAAKHRRYE